MKIANSTIKTIAALCIMVACVLGTCALVTLVSCSLNSAGEQGTLIIKLPGAAAARAASPDFSEIHYRIECVSGAEKVSRNANAGDSISIALAPGTWNVTLTVLDAQDQEIGRGEAPAVIISGKTATVKIDIAVSQYPYLGETLKLSGQVLNDDNMLYEEINTSVESNIGGSGAIVYGILKLSIGAPQTLQSLKDNDMIKKMNNSYTSLTYTPETTQCALLSLSVTDVDGSTSTLIKKEITTNVISLTVFESVDYLYVDRDVTITAKGRESTESASGSISTTITSDLNLNLKKGWNALYSEEKNIYDNYDLTTTISRSLRNPALKWVLESY